MLSNAHQKDVLLALTVVKTKDAPTLVFVKTIVAGKNVDYKHHWEAV